MQVSTGLAQLLGQKVNSKGMDASALTENKQKLVSLNAENQVATNAVKSQGLESLLNSESSELASPEFNQSFAQLLGGEIDQKSQVKSNHPLMNTSKAEGQLGTDDSKLAELQGQRTKERTGFFPQREVKDDQQQVQRSQFFPQKAINEKLETQRVVPEVNLSSSKMIKNEMNPSQENFNSKESIKSLLSEIKNENSKFAETGHEIDPAKKSAGDLSKILNMGTKKEENQNFDFNPNSAQKSQLTTNSQDQSLSRMMNQAPEKMIAQQDLTKSQILAKNPARDQVVDQDQVILKQTSIPGMKSYQKQNNVMNDHLIRNSKDLAFKDTKKLKEKMYGEDLLNGPEAKSTLSQVQNQDSNLKSLMNENKMLLKVDGSTHQLDLSKIDMNNSKEIINRISNYLEQNNLATSNNLEVSVKHEQLGQFKINASKMNQGSDLIDLQITTSSPEAHKFFMKHENELLQTLNKNGVQLSDFKVMTAVHDGQSSSSSSFGQSFSQNGREQYSSSQFESKDFDQGQQRRKELWNEYRERLGA